MAGGAEVVGNARAGFAPKHPFCREDPGRRAAHVAQVLFALRSGFSLPTTQAETQHYSAIATAGRQAAHHLSQRRNCYYLSCHSTESSP